MVRSPTAPSNDAFDAHLLSLDPAIGLRDAQEVSMQALSLGLEALADEAMSANNRMLIFRCLGTTGRLSNISGSGWALG